RELGLVGLGLWIRRPGASHERGATVRRSVTDQAGARGACPGPPVLVAGAAAFLLPRQARLAPRTKLSGFFNTERTGSTILCRARLPPRRPTGGSTRLRGPTQ